MKQLLLLLCLCAAFFTKAQNISILAPKSLLDTSITLMAIGDVQQLLKQACNCDVKINDSSAAIVLKLPSVSKELASQPNRFAKTATFPYRNYPEHNYTWKLQQQGSQTVLQLITTSWQGVSFGLYGLLQEKLGFRFYHPKASIIPHWTEFPLKTAFTFNGFALFDKKGFHIHSQHPLELTEKLLDPTYPRAIEDVKEYIDWLTRNGQTYFEFCLLESIDRKIYPAHAKAMVDYTHQRGLMAAVDLSLHMIQQKTFQLYRNFPKSWKGKKKQIVHNLEWLMQADWDIINMEFSTAEFIGGNKGRKEKLRLFIIDWLAKNTDTKLMGRQHIVKHENETGDKKKGFEWDSASAKLDKERGVLSHTVMFYDMTEPSAPVYENTNQRHNYEYLLEQMKIRETWYYPESAYWVTFDNSIPLFLLPYLSARLSDIDTCVAHKVPGHITFSSGWEWGYWLIDWTIARLSWQYITDGVAEQRTADMYAKEILDGNAAQKAFNNALALQQHYLKDSNLIQWLTAMTVLDEISIKALSDQYQPRPDWSYKFLRREASKSLIDTIQRTILPQLKAFADESAKFARDIRTSSSNTVLANELADGVAITGLRSLHRYYTLQHLLNKRLAKLNKTDCKCDSLLVLAAGVRDRGIAIVKVREPLYRYPADPLSTKWKDHTSYHFGYLYTVRNLHYWKREEEQARRNKFSPFFMKIMNLGRIAGIID